MKRLLCMVLIMMFVLTLSGCGGGDSKKEIFIAEILSDQRADGDIAYDPVLDAFFITNGPDVLFFGIDDADPNFPEFRAFLDFPLDGSLDDDVVPLDADIESATLEFFVDEVSFAGTIPVIMDLVTFSINGLGPADFDSPPLRFPNGAFASIGFDIFLSDVGAFVAIDVTDLMREVQRRGLSDFQVRFILDFITDTGLVGIRDLPNIAVTAPLLIVEFY